MKIIHILKSSKLYLLLPFFLFTVPILGAQLSGLNLSTPIIQKHHQSGFKSIIVMYLSPNNKADYYDDVNLFIGDKKVAQLSFDQQVIIPLSTKSDISKIKLEAKYETETQKCQFKNQSTRFITCNIKAIKKPETSVQLML
tara:strand:+ start:270 stop:692 length:423 start_codon:yes stop_codon:yes gene_type:complete